MNTSTLACAFLLSCTLLPAQLAAYRIVGQSCTTGRITRSIGPVPLSVTGVPRLGTTFQVTTESWADYPWGNRRQVFLLTGISNTSIGGVPLPFDIATLFPNQPFCGVLRTSAEVWTPVPFSADYRQPSSITFSIPNSRGLLGVKFYQQAWSIERSSFGPPFRSGALSAGGEGTVGL